MKVLVLGDGILAKEIVNQSGWDYISRKKDNFDVTKIDIFDFKERLIPYDVILNCIAYTETYSDDREKNMKINCFFVDSLINFCNQFEKKLIHISTDYIYTNSKSEASEEDVPVHLNTWYGYSKLVGDALVQIRSKSFLVCRLSHKPFPFPYEKAWFDIKTNGDLVNIIAEKILKLISKNCSGVFNVGTDIKSVYDMVKKIQDIEPALRPKKVPYDTTMNLNKQNSILKNNQNRPFFSIAIPTYGYKGQGVEFLVFSLQKICSQLFKDFEVIISDHSIDNTILEVCEEWSKKLNLKYFRNDVGRGVISPNINNAMKYCSGEWIKILFQDDFLYDEQSLLKQQKFIKNKENLNWFFSHFYHSNTGFDYYRYFSPEWNDSIWKGYNTLGCPSGLTIKNNDIIFFDNQLNWLMDCDYYYRMNLIHGNPDVLPEVTVVNRTWGERLTDTITEDIKNKELNILKNKYA